MLGTWITLTILQVVVVPLTAVFFGIVPVRPLGLALVCVLDNLGFAALATLFASISLGTRARRSSSPC